MNADHPRLSVVVVEVSDTVGRRDLSHLAGCLNALERQVDPPPMEVLVPYHASTGAAGFEGLKERFPGVAFLPIHDLRSPAAAGSREHHDELRARGLAKARGDLVGLLEDHARPDPRWCARAVEAHEGPWSAVGGAIENDVERPLNWAVYFCDFYRYLNPVPAGDAERVSDANVVYRRADLEAIRPVWETSFNEPAVNGALAARGARLALDPRLVVHQHRVGLTLTDALGERFVWGRSYAAGRAPTLGTGRRILVTALSPALPPLLLVRMAAAIRRKGRGGIPFLRALPLTALLTAAWSAGEAVGTITGRAGADRGTSADATPREG